MARQQYIDNAQLEQQWREWCSTADDPSERTLSDKFALNIMKIANHLLNHERFRLYNHEMKEDMASVAYLKTVRNLKNFKPDKGKLFSYITTCCWTAYVDYLSRHYKDINGRRTMLLQELNRLRTDNGVPIDPQVIQHLERLVREYDDSNEEGNEQ